MWQNLDEIKNVLQKHGYNINTIINEQETFSLMHFPIRFLG
jgi:hypothetical protein